MYLKNILLAAFAYAASVQAQSFFDVLNNDPDLSAFKSTVNSHPELVQKLSEAKDVTILAPTDSAFKKFLEENAGAENNNDIVINLIQYHVITGTYDSSHIKDQSGPLFLPTLLTNPLYSLVDRGQTVGVQFKDNKVVFRSGLLKNSTVVKADIKFNGGILHLIDEVLTIPANVSETAKQLGLNQLARSLAQGGIVETIDKYPGITIFGPNDQAFAEIQGSISSISQHDLAYLLFYHVVGGSVSYSPVLRNGQRLLTLNGAVLAITTTPKGIAVNGFEIVLADVITKNGVVHVISKVINTRSPCDVPHKTRRSAWRLSQD